MITIQKLNVKDETLSGEPRYTIRDNTGNVLYANVDITFITGLLQEGTLLNKVLFDKIDRNFEEIQEEHNHDIAILKPNGLQNYLERW